ncbi:YciI family protein [Agromyces seonyuensis]|uniref:YciI family protein n=1 Tax=Agromyces seonyuensis TaxID=2662446 RepID=A0A6I4NZI3_9MICO|nr:YciI family protein [Agromyces seonyuensis]MWB99733.1 YciI family protein [Agromyces seonyuensis]
MRYTLLMHYPEVSPEELGDEVMEAGRQAMSSYAATLQAAGVLIGAEVLQPSDATTTLRKVDGALRIQDGPFADTKEQFGGSFVIDVPDLDAALDWAGRAPGLDWEGAIEVRPGATHTVDGMWMPNV